MDELRLQKEAYALKVAISENLLNDIESVQFMRSHIAHQLYAEVRGHLFCKDAGAYTYKTPATWLDHLKETSPFVRRVFGEPNYKTAKLCLRVFLDPESYRVSQPSPELTLVSMDEFSSVYNSEESVRMNDMVFYPHIYKMEN